VAGDKEGVPEGAQDFGRGLAVGVVATEKGEFDSRKPAIGATDRHVQDEKERLVKGRIRTARAAPGIYRDRAVDGFSGKFAVGPQVLVLGEVEEDDLLQMGLAGRLDTERSC
jgi:hypothetical protein